ncbi:MAG TPA: ribbon-helix-helix protein, CopG family [Polyangium sp.]|nr:ribbon-helix-helix protein, CopG family [Polyangium sp.]
MSGPVRLELELPERVRARLEELRAMNGADSLTEVVRRALATYDVLLTATRNRGNTIVQRSHDGAEREVFIP